MRTRFILGNDINFNMVEYETFHSVWSGATLAEGQHMYAIEHPAFENVYTFENVRIYVSKDCDAGKQIRAALSKQHKYEITVAELFLECLLKCINSHELKQIVHLSRESGKQAAINDIKKSLGLSID